jgi:signal transduction histidine kinase
MTSDSEALTDPQFLLLRARPGDWHKRLGAGLMLLLLVAVAAASPFAQAPVPGSEPFLAAYATAILVNDLITAVLLLALASVAASPAVLSLAAGYLFLALMMVPWALTFPGTLAPAGLIDAGLQGTAVLAAIRRIGFPLFVIAYVLLKDRPRPQYLRHGGAAVLGTVLATVALVVALCWLVFAGGGALPRLMLDTRNVSAIWQYVATSAVGLYLVALLLLWRYGRSVLDFWLVVVVGTLLIEVVLLSFISAGSRLSIGWWTGRAFGLVSASVVLFVLLAETTTLYARLARATALERRAQESRMATMEALSASIAHEVNQPLASMVTNADAGIRWLDREQPDPAEARAALARVVREGHRAGEIVDGIRSIFRKGEQHRLALDVNEIARGVLKELHGDLRLAETTVETDLDPGVPRVRASRVQLEQVLSNLVVNAVEAMGATPAPRHLRIGSATDPSGGVLVSVADTGVGLGSTDPEAIFEPFVTTKPDGLGMGLMLCRSIVEAHGGRLWAEPGVARGAVFKFSLPEDPGGPEKAGRPWRPTIPSSS